MQPDQDVILNDTPICLDQIKSSVSSVDTVRFDSKIPQKEIVYITQMLLLFVVILSSIINLSLGKRDGAGPQELWIVLLSTSLGAALPTPKLSNQKGFYPTITHKIQ